MHRIRWQRHEQHQGGVKLYRLTNPIRKHIREFCNEKFENDIQEASNWNLVRRIKEYRIRANLPIHGQSKV